MGKVKRVLVRCYNNFIDFKRDMPMRFKRCKDFWYRKTHKQPKIMSIADTVNYILDKKCSVSRFGDGEMKIVCGDGIFFQKYDERLCQRLREILLLPSEKYFVCLMDMFGGMKFFRKKSKRYMQNILAQYRKRWLPHLSFERVYGNTLMTRCYLDWKNKSFCGAHFELLKQIWNGKDIVIIEGEKSRLGYGNDLFAGAKSIKRILGPAKNAFDKYDEILCKATELIGKDKLILLALGPTATVLAYDLDKLGYQAVDIGHVDIEYEWFLEGATDKIPVKNKFIGEVEGGDKVCSLEDEKYTGEILAKII